MKGQGRIMRCFYECSAHVIALRERYSNYRRFVKYDSVAREVVLLTNSGMVCSISLFFLSRSFVALDVRLI